MPSAPIAIRLPRKAAPKSRADLDSPQGQASKGAKKAASTPPSRRTPPDLHPIRKPASLSPPQARAVAGARTKNVEARRPLPAGKHPKGSTRMLTPSKPHSMPKTKVAARVDHRRHVVAKKPAAEKPEPTPTPATAAAEVSQARAAGKPVRFACKRLLGKGAFASVWRGVDQRTGESVAVKIVKDPKHFKTAQYEYYMGSLLDHPNIVKPVQCLQSGTNGLVIVQEFVPGGELFDRVVLDYGVPEDDARFVLGELLDTLAYMRRQGVVHRDIKPENIVMDADGRPKLCDLGMAEFAGQVARRGPGTLPYMPPEVLAAKRSYAIDPSQDMWSLGIVLFVMVTGDFPWMKAKASDPEYAAWCNGDLEHCRPWKYFTPQLLRLFKMMFNPDPRLRCTPEEAQELLYEPWFIRRSTPRRVVKAGCNDERSPAEEASLSVCPMLGSMTSAEIDAVAEVAAEPVPMRQFVSTSVSSVDSQSSV